MVNEPLIELETRLAFLDDLVQTLNDAVATHDQQLNRLERSLADLKEQLQALPGGESANEDEAPPHY